MLKRCVSLWMLLWEIFGIFAFRSLFSFLLLIYPFIYWHWCCVLVSAFPYLFLFSLPFLWVCMVLCPWLGWLVCSAPRDYNYLPQPFLSGFFFSFTMPFIPGFYVWTMSMNPFCYFSFCLCGLQVMAYLEHVKYLGIYSKLHITRLNHH